MTGFLYSQALRDFLRARRLIPWLMMCGIVALLGLAWERIEPTSTPVQRYGDLSSMLIFRIVALSAAIYVTSIIGQEVEQKTIVYLLTRPIERWKLLLTRFLAAATSVALIGLIAALLLSAVLLHGNPFANELLGRDSVAIVLGSLEYGALFLMVSLLSSRAMMICIVFSFGWEWAIPNLPGDLYRLSVSSYMEAIAQHPMPADKKTALLAGTLGTNLITTSSAYAVMGIVTIAVLGLALWWFTHYEYVPREDTE